MTDTARIDHLENQVRRLTRVVAAFGITGCVLAGGLVVSWSTERAPATKLVFADGTSSVEITAHGIKIRASDKDVKAETSINAGVLMASTGGEDAMTMITGSAVVVSSHEKGMQARFEIGARGPGLELWSPHTNIHAEALNDAAQMALTGPNDATAIAFVNPNTAGFTAETRVAPSGARRPSAGFNVSAEEACTRLDTGRVQRGQKKERITTCVGVME